jgi:hypothetical protein
MPVVIMREELGLDLRHVDAGGALRLARLAGDAEIERLHRRVVGEIGW